MIRNVHLARLAWGGLIIGPVLVGFYFDPRVVAAALIAGLSGLLIYSVGGLVVSLREDR